MSRLGKKPISIPEKTEVTISGSIVNVKGPKGELSKEMKPIISIEAKDGKVTLNPISETREASMLWGTYASHILNMIKGVNEGYEKKLSIEGVGYRAEIVGRKIVLSVGFSHPVEVEIPEGTDVKVEKNIITISGINKEVVGQLAAVIKLKKKPEPYKGKGIRYVGEVIRRKEGKKTV